MTKEITAIDELLEYLRSDRDGISMAESQKWAIAVEQLQEDVKNQTQIGHEFFEDAHRLQAKVEAYERILDKGLTVNVYQDGKKPPVVTKTIKDDIDNLSKETKDVLYEAFGWTFGESEDKVEKTPEESRAYRKAMYETGSAVLFAESAPEIGKVEKPNNDQLPLATEYRILINLMLMGAEADTQYVRDSLKRLDNRGKSENSEEMNQ